MTKKEKSYKTTKNITIPDVPNSYAEMFKRLMSVMDDKTKTGIFNDMVMSTVADYYSEEFAEELLAKYQEQEAVLEARFKRLNGPY